MNFKITERDYFRSWQEADGNWVGDELPACVLLDTGDDEICAVCRKQFGHAKPEVCDACGLLIHSGHQTSTDVPYCEPEVSDNPIAAYYRCVDCWELG